MSYGHMKPSVISKIICANKLVLTLLMIWTAVTKLVCAAAALTDA